MARRRAKRDTYNYVLKRGRRIVYRGITNDPERRLNEHRKSSKRFTRMVVDPYPCSRRTARKREEN
jgi:predicted GIY-YIG superfamily endonuclease